MEQNNQTQSAPFPSKSGTHIPKQSVAPFSRMSIYAPKRKDAATSTVGKKRPRDFLGDGEVSTLASPFKVSKNLFQFGVDEVPAGFRDSAGIDVHVIPICHFNFFALSVLSMHKHRRWIASEEARNSDHANGFICFHIGFVG